MEKKKLWSAGSGPTAESILAMAVSAFLVILFLFNAHLLLGPAKKLVKGESDFEDFVAEIQLVYSENTVWKEPFVNLSGLVARATGQKVCNGAIRLNNGMLCFPSEEKQYVYWVGDNLSSFAYYLVEKGVPFLYVQAPCKVDQEGALLPEGVEYFANADGDDLINYLAANGLYTLDLRPTFSATAEQVGQNFYRTDHHWTFETALRACPIIVERMDEILRDRTLDAGNVAFDQWEAHTLEDWFLGSLGKRVGVHYGGVDDLTYYTPKFETHMSMAVMNHQELTVGDFIQANMCMEYAERKDYFNDSPYCIYVGGDYPLVQHRNAGAPNQMKVLLIKDSYSLPVQCYLSTVFSEVDVLDPRYFPLGIESVAEYAAMSQPDIVLMILNPVGGPSSEEYSAFGTQIEQNREAAMTGKRTVLTQGDVEIPMSEKDYSYVVMAENLEPGKRYTFHCDQVAFLEGGAAADGVMAALYNNGTDNLINNRIFDVEYCNGKDGFTWTFDVPAQETGQVQFLLYAGMPGKTQGIELTYRNASLTLEE